ncbi:hypothetical protein P8C59_004820 [Phyllachora maydis]|uniref:Chitin deacetylase n=1 Tax=Phyllachora maydis TaxID=1825666 RepID=A0AAD9I4E4_9PEZI|nr:hypothetical protein P8C59_004820 [Phyllachora maydis]
MMRRTATFVALRVVHGGAGRIVGHEAINVLDATTTPPQFSQNATYICWSSPAFLVASLHLAAAHGDDGYFGPRLFGARKFWSEMRARRGTGFTAPPAVEHVRHEGWCGTTSDYCSSPDCQINYGTGCDANQKPSGLDTSTVSRAKLGSLAYGGAGVYDCVNAGDIAITFDDGPYLYTNDLLDKLKSYGAHATFMVTGNNLGKGKINDPSTPYPAILRRMIAEGHQIASHSWSHQNYSELTSAQFTEQIVWNEIAINSVLGFFPTYWRPPYSICPSGCESALAKQGYHVIYFDLDTEGYLNDDATLIQNSKNIWDAAVNPSNPATDSFLNIEHDIHYQTVYNLTEYMLASLFKHGYKSVTVGQCLGDPSTNWYRNGPAGSITVPTGTTGSGSGSASSAPTSSATPTGSLVVSLDGSCGAADGQTCAGSEFGSCCSQYGYCGSVDDYCSPANGCQPAYGTCSASSNSASPLSAST